jgi:hypothetical protein
MNPEKYSLGTRMNPIASGFGGMGGKPKVKLIDIRNKGSFKGKEPVSLRKGDSMHGEMFF